MRTVRILALALLSQACTSGDPEIFDEPPEEPEVEPPPAGLGFATSAAYVWLPGAGADGSDVRYMTHRAPRSQGPPFAVAGDFDGDGLDSVGTYEWTTGTFHLRN